MAAATIGVSNPALEESFGNVMAGYITGVGIGQIAKGVQGIRGAGGAGKVYTGTRQTLINSATIPGKGGVTPVGRAFQKHAGNPNRAGTFTGDVAGNAAKNTEQGTKYLNSILDNPNSIYTVRNTKAFGDVLDVRLPDGTGARWSADGKTFIMFLEKYTPIR